MTYGIPTKFLPNIKLNIEKDINLGYYNNFPKVLKELKEIIKEIEDTIKENKPTLQIGFDLESTLRANGYSNGKIHPQYYPYLNKYNSVKLN